MNLDGIARRIRALLPPPESYAVIGYTHDAGAPRVVCGTDPGSKLRGDELQVLTERGLPEWEPCPDTRLFMTGCLVATLHRKRARLAAMDKYQGGLLRDAWRDNAVLPRCDAPAQEMLRAIGYKP